MAEHTLSILVKAIGAGKAAKDLKGVDQAVSNIGSRAGQGLRTAGTRIAALGVVAAAGIGAAVHSGIQDLALLEDATMSVDGAIQQMGLTGKVTSTQVATWANEIEANVHAAFDDKAITQATTTLIRFGKVTPGNLKPAMVVMTDLAAKTGSVDSAATLLGKALADPTKAAGKLARQGIILTKEQQKQIKAMMKAGDLAGAQAVVLDAVAKSTKGAADASQGPYRRALSVLADVSEDAKKALAEGFLPVIEKVADLLGKELAKPQTMANIREFGQTLASGLDSLIEIAKNLPWKTIGDSLKLGGQGAKTILSAFASLPPWVQTAIATSWGLNKLTGGALGGIIGDLGKGLIKGVLGMNAGVVNIKAGVVNGAGGPGGAAGGGGGTGKLGKALAGASIVGDIAAVLATWSQVNQGSTDTAASVHGTQQVMLQGSPTTDAIKNSIAGVDQGIKDIQSNPLLTLVQGEALTTLQNMKTELTAQLATTDHNAGKHADDLVTATKGAATRAVNAAAKHTAAIHKVNSSIDHDRAATVSAIHAKKLSVKVSQNSKTTVKVSVTAAGVKQSITHLQRATKSGGTYTSGGYD